MKGLIILLAVKLITASWCPQPPESIAPCVCYHNTLEVHCTGNISELSLYKLNSALSWNLLYIHQTNLSSIQNNSLGDTKWQHIYIHDNPMLRFIEANAFKSGPHITLWIANNTNIRNSDVYAVVKQLKNTEQIFLEYNALSSPPSMMFNAESRVKYFRINNNKIVRIHSNTFTGAKFLETVQLNHNNIYAIDPNGLDFTHESEDRRTIAVILDNNHLNNTSINENTFRATNSSTKIMLSLESNEFTILKKEFYEPFLSNGLNELYFDNNNFSCDCSFMWLFGESILPRVFSVECVNKHRSLFQLNISEYCFEETTTNPTATITEELTTYNSFTADETTTVDDSF